MYHVQGRRGITIEARRPGALLLVTLAAVVVVDQVVKIVIREWLHPSQSFPVVEGFFYLTHVRNTGAAFGLMPGQTTLFVVTSLLVLAAIALYWWRVRPTSLVLSLSLALVSAGAIGNLIDRVLFGRVTDFFDFRVFPVFNVADVAIVTGAIGLFAWALLAPVDQHDERHIPASSVTPVADEAGNGDAEQQRQDVST